MTEPMEAEDKPVLRHKYSMDATLARSIPVVEPEAEVGRVGPSCCQKYLDWKIRPGRISLILLFGECRGCRIRKCVGHARLLRMTQECGPPVCL